MISVKFKYRPSAIDDREGSVYYQVISNRIVRQVPTSYKIWPNEWDSRTGDLVAMPPVHRANYLAAVRHAMQADMDRLLRIGRELAHAMPHVTVESILREYRRHSQSATLFTYSQQVISRYRALGRHRTSETYSATLSSFRKFRGEVDVFLYDIDSNLMESYQAYLHQKGLAPNTVSFYLKHLRAIYNRAVDDGLVSDRKPFKRVSTTTEKTAKRAISLHAIKRLKALDCSSHPSRLLARDMFLFSFYTRGMSFVDIAFLKKKDLKGNVLYYRRKKTNQLLAIHWEPCMQTILRAHTAENASPYLFSIIKTDEDPRRQYLNILCLINRYLKEMGEKLGLHHPLTMYCARHSWASIAHQEGIPVSVISEGMGHDSEKTTQIYLASLKTEVIDRANRKILKLL